MSVLTIADPVGRSNGGYLHTTEHMETLRDWIIPYKHMKMGKPLGQGQFGKVFLGTLQTKTGAKEEVAVKTIKGNSSNCTGVVQWCGAYLTGALSN